MFILHFRGACFPFLLQQLVQARKHSSISSGSSSSNTTRRLQRTASSTATSWCDVELQTPERLTAGAEAWWGSLRARLSHPRRAFAGPTPLRRFAHFFHRGIAVPSAVVALLLLRTRTCSSFTSRNTI